MTEEKRKRIARKFLEENFGKFKNIYLRNGAILQMPFELWRNWWSMENGKFEARAFSVINPPYVTGSTKPCIAVSDSKDELREIMNKIVPEERLKTGCPELEEYKGYYIMYD